MLTDQPDFSSQLSRSMTRARGDDYDEEGGRLRELDSVSPAYSSSQPRPRVAGNPFGGGITTETPYGGAVNRAPVGDEMNRAGLKFLDDLSATQWDAEQGKVLRHDWRTLRRFCTLLDEMCGFALLDADVRRADVFAGLLTCARKYHRVGNGDMVDVMRNVLRGIIRDSDLTAHDQADLIEAVVAYSSTTSLKLCAACEALATRVRGFDGLLHFCLHGTCPCVAAPASDLVRPMLHEPAYNPAPGPDSVGVAAGEVDVKEASTTGEVQLSCAATEAVSAVLEYEPRVQPAGGNIDVALALHIHGPLTAEQSTGVMLLAVSTRLVTEALLMLLVAVAYRVAEARCGDACAVLDSMAVELIDSGNDPPVTVLLSC